MPLPPEASPDFVMDPGVTDPGPNGSPVPVAPPPAGSADPPNPLTPGVSDVSQTTKLTLGKYLSNRTMGVNASDEANEYPIDAPQNNQVRPFAITTPAGNPAKLEHAEDVNSKVFIPSNEAPPTYSENIGDLQGADKGKVDNPTITGNKLLASSTDPTMPAPPVPAYQSKVITNNRFYADGPQFDPNVYAYRHIKDQSAPVIKNRYDLKQVSFDDLSKVGKTLTLRAAGTLGSQGRGFDPESTAASAAALLPGPQQLAVTKANMNDLEARDVLEAIINDDINQHGDKGPNSQSWGNLNTVLDPFTGIAPLGMIALAIALILASQIALKLFIALITLVPGQGTQGYDPTTLKYFPGVSVKSADSDSNQFGGFSIGGAPNLMALLGMRQTVFPFGDAAQAGIKVFFRDDSGGSNPLTGLGAAVVGSFKAAIESPGYYAIFVRAIVRSTLNLTSQISFGSNPISIIEGILGIIDALRSSKLIAALNMFAEIGDNELLLEKKPPQYDIESLSDLLPAQYKSRQFGGLKLSWRSNNTPSMYLLPTEIRTAAALTPKTKGDRLATLLSSDRIALNGPDPDLPMGTRGTQVFTTGPRLKPEDVQAMEDLLEGEYMPFYFQDLRTNEIISFHAFITAMSDEFTVNHENIEAYGRIDPIKIYKNTIRRISVGFKIVSTDVDDFDDMWVKINKLTTMVYPQWTAGTLASPQGGPNFVQPFSQIPGGAPVIRLRLGDLFKNNATKFAIARLFGLGQKETFTSENVTLDDFKAVKSVKDFYRGKLDDVVSGVKSLQDANKVQAYVLPGNYPKYDGQKSGGAISLPSIPGVGSDKEPATTLDTKNWQPTEAKLTGDTSNGAVVVEVTLKDPKKSTTVKIVVPKTAISLKLRDAALANGPSQALVDFFDDTTNTITKSFKQAGGRGLACVIESLSFNWLDNTTWETGRFNAYAPKMCDVTIALAPMHDIAPGLDSFGFNRAPIYNVGDAMAGLAGVNQEAADSYDAHNKKLAPAAEDRSTGGGNSDTTLGVKVP